MSDALLAACLLGLDQARQNIQAAVSIQFQDPVQASFNVPPKEAVEYFQQKKVLRKREFDKLTREAKSGAFTVTGVYREDVLRGFKDELSDALVSGRTQEQTVNRFRKIISGAASQKLLGDFHLETVFRSNMQMAYGVGRRQGLEQVTEDLPFWQYHSVMDDRTRPHHAALNGLTLAADHSFWNDHYPPWGFNCRCIVTAIASLPEGYDPKNPSGLRDEHGEPLTQISYDDRGVPAKAEHGTSFYDLAAGKFSGVPPYSSLKSAIEAGVERAKEARRKKKS